MSKITRRTAGLMISLAVMAPLATAAAQPAVAAAKKQACSVTERQPQRLHARIKTPDIRQAVVEGGVDISCSVASSADLKVTANLQMLEDASSSRWKNWGASARSGRDIKPERGRLAVSLRPSGVCTPGETQWFRVLYDVDVVPKSGYAPFRIRGGETPSSKISCPTNAFPKPPVKKIASAPAGCKQLITSWVRSSDRRRASLEVHTGCPTARSVTATQINVKVERCVNPGVKCVPSGYISHPVRATIIKPYPNYDVALRLTIDLVASPGYGYLYKANSTNQWRQSPTPPLLDLVMNSSIYRSGYLKGDWKVIW